MSSLAVLSGETTEHMVLLRHLAQVQTRVSEQCRAQEQRCAALEAELMRWRARWLVATTQMLWGLGWPQVPLLPRAERQERSAAGAWPADMSEVLCQTGCVGHAHHWRDDEGQCRLRGGSCAHGVDGSG